MYTYIECAGSDVLVVAGINIRSILRVSLPPAKAARARLFGHSVTTFAPLQVTACRVRRARRNALIQHLAALISGAPE